MIIYKNNAIGFREDVESNGIAEKITAQYKMILGRTPQTSEQNAFRNSMNYMERIIRNSQVADDCGILIEYVVPNTSNRIDFLISGHDDTNQANFVIIELKQWQNAQSTDQDGIVQTAVSYTHLDVYKRQAPTLTGSGTSFFGNLSITLRIYRVKIT